MCRYELARRLDKLLLVYDDDLDPDLMASVQASVTAHLDQIESVFYAIKKENERANG